MNQVNVDIRANAKSFVDELDKSTAAAQRLIDKYDPLGAKLRTLEADFNELGKAAAKGHIAAADDSRVDAAYAGMRSEIAATKAAMAGLGEEGKAAGEKAMFGTAGARRELIVLGHEAMTGNFSKMPGSFMVLAERVNLSTTSLIATGAAIAAISGAAFIMGKAIADGAAEMHGMNDALQITSNFAGQTRGQMRELADQVSSLGMLTIGESKDIVTALVGSGQIGAGAIREVARLTEDYAHASGKEIDKIAPSLVKLFADPAKGAEELNKSMHFLSAAELEHIQHLERIGEKTAAQLELAQKLESHLPKQIQSLGFLQKAWLGVAQGASSAWDAMMGAGRDKTTEEKYSALRSRLLGMAGEVGTDIKGLPAKVAGTVQAASVAKDIAEYERLEREIQKTQGAAKDAGAAAEANEKQQKAAAVAAGLSISAQRQALQDKKQLLQENMAPGRVKNEAIEKLDEQIANLGKKAAAALTPYERLTKSITDKIAVEAEEAALGRPLTDAEKLRASIINELDGGYRKLTKAQRENIDAKIEDLIAFKAENIEREARKKSVEEWIKSDQAAVGQLDAEIKKQKESYDAIGLTKAQLDEMRASRDLDTAAAKDSEAQTFRTAAAYAGPLADAYMRHANALDLEAQKLRELAVLQEKSAIKQASADIAKKTAEEFAHAYQSIESGLSMALANGGKDGLKSIGDAFKAWMKTMATQMILRPIVQPIYAGMASMMGVDMTKAGGTWASPGGINGTGSLLNTGSNLYSLFNGSSVGSGMYGTFAASSVGQSMGLSNVASFIGPQLEGVATGATAAEVGLTSFGSALGAAVPYVAAAAAIYSLFSGKGGGPKSGGGSGASIVDGAYVDMGRGAVSYTPSGDDASMTKATSALASDYLRYTSSLGGVASNTKMSLAYDSDPNGTASNRISGLVTDKNGKDLFVDWNHDVGRDSANLQAQLSLESKKMLLAALQGSDMPTAVAAVLSTVDAAGATSDQIDKVLTLAQTFKTLGQVLPDIAGMSSDSIKALAKGVSDQFGAEVSSYYTTFYSQTERDIGAKATGESQIKDTFAALNIAIPKSDEEFKALVSGLDRTTDSGIKTTETLLKIAPTFDVIQKATTALLNNAIAAYIGYQSAVGNTGAGLAASSAVAGVNDGKAQDKLAAAFGLDRATLDRAITQAGGNLGDIAAKYWSQMNDAQRAAITDAMNSKAAYIGTVKAQFDEQLKLVQSYYASVKKLSDLSAGIDANIASVKIAAGLLTAADYNAQQTAKVQTALAALGPDANVDDKISLATQLRDLTMERWTVELDSLTKAKEFAGSVRDYLNNLKVSDNSPLDLQSKLAEAAKQYADTLTAANNDDATARSALTGKADAWLALSKQYGMGEWASVYQQVQNGLGPLADTLSIDQQSLATQKTTAQRAADTVAQLQAIKGQATDWQTTEQGLLNSAITGLQPLTGILNGLGASGAIASAINALPDALAALIGGGTTKIANKVVNTPQSIYAASGADATSISAFNALTQPGSTSSMSAQLAADKAISDALASGSTDPLKNALIAGTVSIGDLTRSANQQLGGWGTEQAMADWARSANVPGYATGGDHLGGWRIVGENGPELEATGPSRIFNAEQTRSLLNNHGGNDYSELIAELRALRAEVARLREEQAEGKNAELQQRAAAATEQISRLGIIARATQDSARAGRLEGALA